MPGLWYYLCIMGGFLWGWIVHGLLTFAKDRFEDDEMIPGTPAQFLLYKATGVIDMNGQHQITGPLASAMTVDGCHAAAKQLNLQHYLIVCCVGIFSNLPQPKLLEPVAPTQTKM